MAYLPDNARRPTPLGAGAGMAGIITSGSSQGVEPARARRVMAGRHDERAPAMKSPLNLLPLALVGAVLATPAAALEPLSQEKYINDRLVAARIADRIRRTCPNNDGRIFYAYGEARKLKRYAENKGYSATQIDTFLDSKEERKRIYAVAEDYLTRRGARAEDPQSFCEIGRAEIGNKSIIGSLLVAK